MPCIMAGLRFDIRKGDGRTMNSLHTILPVSLIAVFMSATTNANANETKSVTSANQTKSSSKVTVIQTGMPSKNRNVTFPSSCPLPRYPGSKCTDSSVQKGKQVAISVTLLTSDSSQQCADFYKSWFQSNGWIIGNYAPMGPVIRMMAITKQLSANVFCIGAQNQTTIGIGVASLQPASPKMVGSKHR